MVFAGAGVNNKKLPKRLKGELEEKGGSWPVCHAIEGNRQVIAAMVTCDVYDQVLSDGLN